MASHNKQNISAKPLTSVMEDYLEAIFDLDKEKKIIRVKDIAKRMNVKMPTVTSMLKALDDRGLVDYEKYEYVKLTKGGAKIGREMRRRHQILLKFLTEILNIEFKTADEEACAMEHALSPDTMRTLTDFMAFIQSCPRTGENWIERFEEYRKYGRRPEKCLENLQKLSNEYRQKFESMEKNESLDELVD